MEHLMRWDISYYQVEQSRNICQFGYFITKKEAIVNIKIRTNSQDFDESNVVLFIYNFLFVMIMI